MTRPNRASFPRTGRIAMTFALSLAAISPAALAADAGERLGLPPSPASTDFVQQRTQFQLHTLLTEQRHPRTWNLSEVAATDPAQALSQLFSVDEDVARAFAALADDPQRMAKLHAASAAVQRALRDGHRIYFYGTGSTGRLAETLESGVWRPFWMRMQADPAWPRIAAKLPADLGERVRGEITGGDRALISSLEGFEDLQLIGALQMRDDGIGADDVVFAVTEGGETSAVIGTALAAADQRGEGSDRVWFVYNNPDEVLRPFERSRRVLDDARIHKIALPTGPQAITGSTRMQATTTSLYALGLVLEDALRALLLPQLPAADAQRLGLDAKDSIESRLRGFAGLQRSVAGSAPQLAQWTVREAQAYADGRHATYLAGETLMPVFVDVTERAPTFRLAPLDRTDTTPPASWIRVWAPVATPQAAWDALLHRPFHGLDAAQYRPQFEQKVDDPALRGTALRSLERAGAEQQALYDLSWSPQNRERLAPQTDDLGVLLRYAGEPVDALARQWWQAFGDAGAGRLTVTVGHGAGAGADLKGLDGAAQGIALDLPQRRDPLGLDRTLALKMLLNAHSTAVMARLGRTVGNTMTAVQPGNLKLIGRATYLIQSHVNAVLDGKRWRARHGATAPLSYAEANVVLYEAIDQRARLPEAAQLPEVELAIVAVLERLDNGKPLDWAGAARQLRDKGLNGYLRERN
jgi:N-acetylmuramic acid 6-phosphate etherase